MFSERELILRLNKGKFSVKAVPVEFHFRFKLFQCFFESTNKSSFLKSFEKCLYERNTLHKKWNFPVRISSVNATKSCGNYFLIKFPHQEIRWNNGILRSAFHSARISNIKLQRQCSVIQGSLRSCRGRFRNLSNI